MFSCSSTAARSLGGFNCLINTVILVTIKRLQIGGVLGLGPVLTFLKGLSIVQKQPEEGRLQLTRITNLLVTLASTKTQGEELRWYTYRFTHSIVYNN